MDNNNRNIFFNESSINPFLLKKVLKESGYWVSYKTNKRIMQLWENNGAGGSILFEAKSVNYETAEKFAKALEVPIHY